jgi:hypothetical protein
VRGGMPTFGVCRISAPILVVERGTATLWRGWLRGFREWAAITMCWLKRGAKPAEILPHETQIDSDPVAIGFLPNRGQPTRKPEEPTSIGLR